MNDVPGNCKYMRHYDKLDYLPQLCTSLDKFTCSED